MTEALNGEAVRAVAELAAQGVKAEDLLKIVPVPGDANGTLLIYNGRDGKFGEFTPVKNRHRTIGVADINDYVQFAVDNLDADVPHAFVSSCGVTVILNGDDRSSLVDVAVCDLVTTDEYDILNDCQSFSHREFIRAIRTKLYDALPVDKRDALLKVLAKLRYESNKGGTSEVGMGRANYGASVANEMASEVGDLAQFERMTLKVRVFTDPAVTVRYEVPVVMDVDAENRTFTLTPIGDALQSAVDETLSEIKSRITACPAFIGTP